MSLKKHGHGEILPEEGDDQKVATKHFSEKDREELRQELDREDESDADRP